MATLRVQVGAAGYPVRIESGLVGRCGSSIRRLVPGGERALVISDRRVAGLYSARLQRSLQKAGLRSDLVLVPRGERAKTISHWLRIQQKLLRNGVERGTPLLALGGGSIGDLAGFVAATYKRGLPLIQLPTTLLAQVDASVGGKVGVNLPAGKNLVGTFYQPRAVFADPATLRSLPSRDFRAGLGEVIKYAMIGDGALLEALERKTASILARDSRVLSWLLRRCLRAKARIVEADERDEKGLREVLNFGHTIGHALEAFAWRRGLRHGEAVSIGMVLATELAARLGQVPFSLREQLERILEACGLPRRHRAEPAKVIRRMRHDKKVRRNRLHFILPTGAGRVRCAGTAPASLLRKVLEWGRQ